MAKHSALEIEMARQLRLAGLPEFVQEYKFLANRRFRADFAWPKYKLLLEVEGGIWTGGRHTNGSGYTRDCEKYTLASLEGWTLIRVVGKHIKSGEALNWVETFFNRRGNGYVGIDPGETRS